MHAPITYYASRSHKRAELRLWTALAFALSGLFACVLLAGLVAA